MESGKDESRPGKVMGKVHHTAKLEMPRTVGNKQRAGYLQIRSLERHGALWVQALRRLLTTQP